MFATCWTWNSQIPFQTMTKISLKWRHLVSMLGECWGGLDKIPQNHYNDVIMSAMASQITNLTIVYSTVYSRRRSKKTSKLRVTGLCVGNSPVTGEFPAQRASNAENVSIWWRLHEIPHGCHCDSPSCLRAKPNRFTDEVLPLFETAGTTQPSRVSFASGVTTCTYKRTCVTQGSSKKKRKISKIYRCSGAEIGIYREK